jgi:flagellar P-ring protein precursor FlgI
MNKRFNQLMNRRVDDRIWSSWSVVCLIITALVLAISFPAKAARLKDMADIEGVRGNQLFGYGLVVGLNGTGDGRSVEFTTKGLSNMLEKVGIRVDSQDIKVKNVAAVLVTATLPPFSRPGGKLDVTLSSMGDAKSLQGGTLLFTPLRGADGNVYAIGQGAVAIGGFTIEGGGDAAVRNHPTVGVITGGATIERSISVDIFRSHSVRVVLREPDFTTMKRVVSALNYRLGAPLAVARDSGVVEVSLPTHLMQDPIGAVSFIEQTEVEQDIGAKIVVNERTGTIIMGDDLRLSPVALAHGNLSISIRNDVQVSQPQAPAGGGQTAVVTNGELEVGEEKRRLELVGGEATLGELVKGLNAIGATPRDLISIFAALKKAGALHADMIVM